MTVDRSILRDMLALVSCFPPFTEIAGWNRRECIAAESWAAAEHLKANDNRGVRMPERPTFLDPFMLRPGETSIYDVRRRLRASQRSRTR